jgi:RimJ/RimL family protein N-acetyltransferase
VELRRLDESHSELLNSLQEQDDVWEFIGSLPLPQEGDPQHLFAVMEDQDNVGFAGLVGSQALDGDDFELLCAMRSDAQLRGLAKKACNLVLAWAFDTAKLDRVIACIDDANEAARAIATKLGMKEMCARPPGRTVYVKYREAGAP